MTEANEKSLLPLRKGYWDFAMGCYVCGDRTRVSLRMWDLSYRDDFLPNPRLPSKEDLIMRKSARATCRYCIKRIKTNIFGGALVSANALFSRDMRELLRGTENARTLSTRGVRTLRGDAFAMAAQLRSVRMGEDLETLETQVYRFDRHGSHVAGAFWNSGVRRVWLPAALKVLSSAMFLRCKGLREIALPEGLECISRQCFQESSLERIEIPGSVTEIEREAFRMCAQLRDIIFPVDSKLESIGERAFAETRIESFTMPASLRVINQGAFCGCSSLR